MQELWQTLPAPAIRLLPAGLMAHGQPRWQLNAAAQRFGHAPVLWQQWAEVIAQAIDAGASTGTLADAGGKDCLRWTAGVLDPGWLAWLEPVSAALGDSATQEVVSQLRQRLDITQRFGRLGIWERDVRTGKGQWDRYIYTLYGLDPDGGTPSMEHAAHVHFHPDDAERSIETWQRSVQQPGQYELHFRLCTRDGRVKSLHSMWEVINGADGKPERAIGVLLDDTESIELAQQHMASTLQLDLAVRLGGIVVWRRELHSDRVFLNEWGYRLLGLPHREDGMPADELAELVHPDDRPAIGQATQRALDYPEAVDVQARYRRADGIYLTALSRRVAVRDDNGKPVALLGVNLDLTERRAAEEQLRSVEQRARLATQAVGMGTWEHRPGPGGSYGTYWDDQMYRLRGLEPGGPQPPGDLHAASLHPADRERAMARLEAALHGSGEAYEDEYRVVWPDGSVRWLAARGMPQQGEAGRIDGMLGVNWDITDYKHAEQALRDKVAAEQASRAKSDFLARVSHELRTPLNAVLGFTRLLATDSAHPLNESQRQRVAIVETAGAHLLALISDTLDLASIEAGTLPLDCEPVPLAPVLAQALQWAQPLAARVGISLEVQPFDAMALGDARRLRQVFVNLLTNAIKYNRTGGSVAVCLLPTADPAWLAVEVRDTGRGLTRTQMSQLFEPFNRLGAEHEDIEGTGIGLTIVHHLVERMGGAIVVDSEPGVGSCFTVWLPAAPRHGEAATAAAVEAVGTAAADTNLGKTLDVLYIEDNAVNVLLVEELVALRPGWTLHVAETGEAGVKKALELRPRVVLVDMQLPDFDGFEVLRRLRGQASLVGSQFIALSANAMPEDIAVAREAGFHDYWTKPIDFGQFLGGLDALSRP